MNLLLDTHTLLWWLDDNSALSRQAASAIAEADNMVWVSAASAWEIAIKKAIGKLESPSGLTEEISRHNFFALPITIKHSEAAGALPPFHRDPFDRMLIAQAKLEDLTIVTRDKCFAQYDVSTLEA